MAPAPKTSEIDKLLNPALGVEAFEKVASRLTYQRLNTLGRLIQERITSLEGADTRKRSAEQAERLQRALVPQQQQLASALARITQSSITALAGVYDDPVSAIQNMLASAAAYGPARVVQTVAEKPETFGSTSHRKSSGLAFWKKTPDPLENFPLEKVLAALLTAHTDTLRLKNLCESA